ncbi:TPA: hypothetical protein L4R50_000078 [Pseudomonas aeruginosa]|nr:hypothetical protein [Pseudomonas aeruginosa]HBP1602238.1 hypothetical protein [Pseudomonas aeruginosa]
MQTNTLDLGGGTNIQHPFADYTLTDAVRLANNNRSLNLLPPVQTLSEARDVVQHMATHAGFTWITGMVALDVLDAAIENRDLRASCRLI